MGRMVRKQVYIESAQDTALKRHARDLGVTEAELIRRGLDQMRRSATAPTSDAEAWQAELAFIRRRARTRAVEGRRRWTRQDVYADRLDRLSR